MALLWHDSFDTDQTTATGLSPYENFPLTTHTISATQARTGTRSLATAGSVGLQKRVTVTGDIIIGVAARCTSWQTTAVAIMGVVDTDYSSVHLTVCTNTSGQLEVRRGTKAGTLLSTATTETVVNNNWHYVELQANIHDSTGSFTLKLDSVQVKTASSQDTRNGGNGVAGAFICGHDGAVGTFIDDLYICDTSGSAPYNTFLGAIKIENLNAVADSVAVGSHTAWSLSTGSDQGALVDEAAANSDTDYVHSNTVGQKVSFQLPSLTLTGTILGVNVRACARKTDVGNRTIKVLTRTGGTDFLSAEKSLINGSYQTKTQIYALNPDTGVTWTGSDITSLQVGAETNGA